MFNLQSRPIFLGALFLLFIAGFSFAVPTVVMIDPKSITYYNRSVLLDTNITDAFLDKCAFSLDGWATNTTFNCTWVRFNASNGSSIVRVRANDTSGGINDSESISFTVSPSVWNYSIPSAGGEVRDIYVYNASYNLTFLEYSIPGTSFWVQAPYVYNPGAGVLVPVYPVPSIGLWVQTVFVYDATTGITTAAYSIPSTGLEVISSNIIYCVSGNDCASVGNLCIKGICKGLIASGSDLGQKCSVDSTNYNLTGYAWALGGCTIPSQVKSIRGIGTFDFNNTKAGIRTFRAYFESDPANSTYTYYLISNTNASDNFANVQLVVFVDSSSARTIRGELVG